MSSMLTSATTASFSMGFRKKVEKAVVPPTQNNS